MAGGRREVGGVEVGWGGGGGSFVGGDVARGLEAVETGEVGGGLRVPEARGRVSTLWCHWGARGKRAGSWYERWCRYYPICTRCFRYQQGTGLGRCAVCQVVCLVWILILNTRNASLTFVVSYTGGISRTATLLITIHYIYIRPREIPLPPLRATCQAGRWHVVPFSSTATQFY